MSKEDLENGLQVRCEVMGEAFVNKAMDNTSAYMEPVQQWINEHAWGSVWQREGLDRKTRSLVTVGMLAALKASTEIKGHIQGALNNGATPEEIREVLLHSAVYCGAPAAQEALRAAKDILEDQF
ncbi:4-carboxymuconolactone decarboxylase [Thalassolituus sp. HI0120]|nr:4-carboxymuconolactone decarboxylase [Thalassolituus sp. HI0120]